MDNNEEVKKENKETYIECPKCERRVKEGEKVCPYCQYDLVNKPKIEREINYKKWWLGGLIAIVIVIIVVIYLSFNNTSKPTAESGNSSTNAILKETKEENPYEIVNNYDGIYSFLLLDKNGSGVSFDSVGAIEINNGNCNIKYKILTKDTENKSNECIREYTGFAGKNREDNSEFYITLQKGKTRKDDIIYKCKLLDNKLLCELTSEFNLSGCYEKKLELIKINDTSSIDFIYNQKLEEEKVRRKEEDNRKAEEEKQAFIASCQSYTFEQIARNPDNFKGTNVKVTGEVIQVMSDNYSTNLRVNITKTGTYATYYTDTIYVVYHPETGEDKILEDDIITIYGTSQGDCSYTTVLGSNVTLPNIKAKYITINK